jgi:predicted DNA-binding protein
MKEKKRSGPKPEGDVAISEYLATRVSKDTYRKVLAVSDKTQRTRAQIVRIFLENGLNNYLQGYIDL